MMRRMLFGATLALTCLLIVSTAAAPARALMIAMPNTSQKIAQSDTIIVGQVMAFEDQDLELPIAPNSKNTAKYRIALVRISDIIKGKDVNKLVRIGYRVIEQPKQPAVQPGIRPLPIRPFPGRGGYGMPSLKAGQSGLFFLSKHPTENFYQLPMSYNFIDAKAQNFISEVKTTQTTLKVLDNPMAGLQSKDQDERLTTVKILLDQYRTPQGSAQQTPVAKEESQLILKTILDAEWGENLNVQPGQDRMMHPWYLFNRLGVQQKDGLVYPQGRVDIQDRFNTAKAWLQKNWQTYQVTKYAPGNGRVGGIGGGPIQIQPFPQPVPRPVPPIQIQPVPGRPIQIQPGNIQIRPIKGKIQIQPIQGRPVQPIQGRPVQIEIGNGVAPAVLPANPLPDDAEKN